VWSMETLAAVNGNIGMTSNNSQTGRGAWDQGQAMWRCLRKASFPQRGLGIF